MKKKYILGVLICLFSGFVLVASASENEIIDLAKFTDDGFPIYVITHGGSIPYYTSKELTEKSDLIVTGSFIRKDAPKWSSTIDGSQPKTIYIKESVNELGDKVFDYRVNIDHSKDTIYTDMFFLVEKTHKGKLPSQNIVIRSFSGTAGAFQINDSYLNAEDYPEGEKITLFLTTDGGSTKDIGPKHYIVLPCGAYFLKDGFFVNSFNEKLQFEENEEGSFIQSFNDENVFFETDFAISSLKKIMKILIPYY